MDRENRRRTRRKQSERADDDAKSLQTDFSGILFPDSGLKSRYCSNELREGFTADPSSCVTSDESHSAARRIASDYLPIFRVKLVVTDRLALRGRPKVRSPADAATLLYRILKDEDREHFVSVLLDTKNQLIGVTTISIGDLSSALVHPREVFKPAILANAGQMIVGHNHPSGDPTPSNEDANVTRRLVAAGELLGIEVLDHIVVGESGRYLSLKERGLM